MNRIKEVFIGSYKKNDYLVIKSSDKTMVLNISNGIEEENIKLSLENIVDIYIENHEYQEPIELSSIEKVELITNVELINKYTNKNVSSPYLICLEDKEKKKLYIDIALNIIYSRKDHYKLKTFANTKIRDIYEKNEKNKIFKNKLLIKLFRKFQILYEIDEEDIV